MTEDFIDRQMGRLSGQEFFSELPDAAIREIRLALLTGDSESVVERVVSDFIAGTSARPTPHELREMCATENERGKAPKLGFQPRSTPPIWHDKDKFDPVAALVENKNLDPEWAAAFIARQEEIKKNPLLGRFGPDGRTLETPAKAALRVACQRMGGNPQW